MGIVDLEPTLFLCFEANWFHRLIYIFESCTQQVREVTQFNAKVAVFLTCALMSW